MKKVIMPGWRIINYKLRPVFCQIEMDGDKLSISGVEGPKSNGDCFGSCGQIEMSWEPLDKYATGWDAAKEAKFLDLWRAWHLNDMRAGCVHQRAEWDISEKLTLQDYKWSTKYHQARTAAANGEDVPENWKEISRQVLEYTTQPNRAHYETPEVRALIDAGWIEEGKTETKTAGWVRPSEHPRGLLMKPCPVCGYQYGSAWLKEEVPQEVIDWLFALPGAEQDPAWV